MMEFRPPVLGNGWARPVPPYITYPVENVGWGHGERPPYWPAKFVERGQIMTAPPAPPPPAPPLRIPPLEELVPPEGPIPVQDWFNLLKG